MSQISGIGIDQQVSGSAPPNRFNEMTSEDFIRVIFSELTNQDPLEPNDTGALLDQLNSLRSIESDLQLTQKLEDLVTENQLAAASNMIGKVVEGRTEDFDRVAGQVVSAMRRDDEIVVRLDSGHEVPLENVESIVDPQALVP